MTSPKNQNLFITSPERVQSLFLFCLERPKSLIDFSSFYRIQPSLYYRSNFLESLVERGIFRLEYIGRKPYLYSLFGEEFRNYYKQILQISDLKKEYITALLNDEEVLIKFYDSDLFRNFWKEDVLRVFDKNEFKKPSFLFSLFLMFISYSILLLLVIDEVNKRGVKLNLESIKLLTSAQLHFFLASFAISVSYAFFAYLNRYFTDDILKKMTFIKNTEYYKVIAEFSKEIPKIGEILTEAIKNKVKEIRKKEEEEKELEEFFDQDFFQWKI